MANKILNFIYKTYFHPIISSQKFGEKEAEKKIKFSISKLTSKDFSTENVFNSLSITTKAKLEKFVELPTIYKDDSLTDKDKILKKKENKKKTWYFQKSLTLFLE